MPPYLTQKGRTYYYRQAVPAELRPILGQREIKKSLGRDFTVAVRECKRFAVTADEMIADARAKLDSVPIDPYSRAGIVRTQHVPLPQLTPELEAQISATTTMALLETDREWRVAEHSEDEHTEYHTTIRAGIEALRRQLATGNVTPMLPWAQQSVVGRGYAPEFSENEWRRLAFSLTEATLEAYEGMALRAEGRVVKAPADTVLPSQFEVQNAARALAPETTSPVTWQKLYDVWYAECIRPEGTRAAYLAAMKLFRTYCSKPPHEVTREDVLTYRDALLQGGGLAVGTVANKVGFLTTLVNAGRNSALYAKHLPHNAFENIRIKREKRGRAGTRRLPFSDSELSRIFGSAVYAEGVRPHGGGGEAAAWIPAIAYLTGMCLEEIAVLTTSQFHVDAAGNPYICVGDAKNATRADREVPLHPQLIDAGLLDYVKQCKGRLFPLVKCANEKESKAYSQWYGRFLTSIGITSPSKVFHSFRHLFKDLARNAGLDDSVIDQICGHEPGSEGGRYGVGRRTQVLAKLIRRIKPPVPLPKITQPDNA